MKPGTPKLFVYSLLNVAASFPIFVVGGSFIFAGNNWGYFGIASMIYAILSCFLLLFTLLTPTKEVLIVDRIAALLMTITSFIVFVVRRMYDPYFVFALGAALTLGIKWTTHTYVFKQKIRS